MTSIEQGKGRALVPRDVGDHARREEWLMDQAIRDSFPASDPPASSRPGSIVYERYAVTPSST